MKKAKIHFDDVFCEQTVQCGIPREILTRYAHILRSHPDLGTPLVPEMPNFRQWIVEIPGFGWLRILYVWSPELGDIDLSLIEKVRPPGTEPPKGKGARILEHLLLWTRLGSAVVRLIKELLNA